jgi:hypothetical protein
MLPASSRTESVRPNRTRTETGFWGVVPVWLRAKTTAAPMQHPDSAPKLKGIVRATQWQRECSRAAVRPVYVAGSEPRESHWSRCPRPPPVPLSSPVQTGSQSHQISPDARLRKGASRHSRSGGQGSAAPRPAAPEGDRHRVGNEECARENSSFGLTTLRDRHVKIDGGTMRFQFRGKSGQMHDVEDRDTYGELHSVDSGDVNGYLQRHQRRGFFSQGLSHLDRYDSDRAGAG